MKRLRTKLHSSYSRFELHAKTGLAFAEEPNLLSLVTSAISGFILSVVALGICLSIHWWALIFLWPFLALTFALILAIQGYVIRREFGNEHANLVLRRHHKNWNVR
jgi:hypothetical protein